MELRVIYDTHRRAFENMGIDEAMLIHLKEIGPTLRLYGWNPPAVSIGYFQSMEEEVDVDNARKLGVDLVRRITGGGAVYHKWELTYSIILPEIKGRILDSYKIIERGIVEGLQTLGLEPKMVGINDIAVNGKKISGNAQTRKYGGLLQHGTILMNVDVDEMFSLLKVPDEKLRDKHIQNVKHRVTSLHHLGIDVEFEELQKRIAEGFKYALNANLYEEELSSEVMATAKDLEVNKYATREWNFRR